MKPLLHLALAASLAATALPAFAQSPTDLATQPAPASWKPLSQRQDDVAAQIARGVDSGALSEPTAHGLRDQFKGLLNLEDEYRKTGFTPAQQADLQARYDTLEARIQVDTHPASIEANRAPASPAGR
jgi:hypothetical protein